MSGKIRWAAAFFVTILASISIAQETPYLYVLGVVQDAGYPQAGCYEPHCMPGWEDATLRRGATCVALIVPEAGKKYLFEASPHLPEQLYQLEREAPSETFSLDGVFLTHAHIGHYAGLMYFGHEAMGASNVPVYAMPRMSAFLEENGPWSQLVEYGNISLKPLQHQKPESFGRVRVTPFLVPHRDEYSETVGYRIEGPNRSAVFIPDIDKWSAWDENLVYVVKSVDYALIDATFYADGELAGRDMSKVRHPFVTESMALLEGLTPEERKRVWFIHLNHTNPLLNSDSEPSREVLSRGFNIAREGIRLPL